MVLAAYRTSLLLSESVESVLLVDTLDVLFLFQYSALQFIVFCFDSAVIIMHHVFLIKKIIIILFCLVKMSVLIFPIK